MIYLYQGTPGSGKSYHATAEIYDWIRYSRNTKVIANFPVAVDKIFYTYLGWVKVCLNRRFPRLKFKVYNKHPVKQDRFFYVRNANLTVDYLLNFCVLHHQHKSITIEGVVSEVYPENQTFVVIDEATVKFNCRGWQDKDREKWCEFFRQHRHFGFNIILITQDEMLLDKQIRCLIETYVTHRNLRYFNWFAKIVSIICGGSTFLCLYRWQGCKDVYHRTVCRYHTRIADIYNSYLVIK